MRKADLSAIRSMSDAAKRAYETQPEPQKPVGFAIPKPSKPRVRVQAGRR